jgi:hypothetical protein
LKAGEQAVDDAGVVLDLEQQVGIVGAVHRAHEALDDAHGVGHHLVQQDTLGDPALELGVDGRDGPLEGGVHGAGQELVALLELGEVEVRGLVAQPQEGHVVADLVGVVALVQHLVAGEVVAQRLAHLLTVHLQVEGAHDVGQLQLAIHRQAVGIGLGAQPHRPLHQHVEEDVVLSQELHHPGARIAPVLGVQRRVHPLLLQGHLREGDGGDQ